MLEIYWGPCASARAPRPDQVVTQRRRRRACSGRWAPTRRSGRREHRRYAASSSRPGIGPDDEGVALVYRAEGRRDVGDAAAARTCSPTMPPAHSAPPQASFAAVDGPRRSGPGGAQTAAAQATGTATRSSCAATSDPLACGPHTGIIALRTGSRSATLLALHKGSPTAVAIGHAEEAARLCLLAAMASGGLGSAAAAGAAADEQGQDFADMQVPRGSAGSGSGVCLDLIEVVLGCSCLTRYPAAAQVGDYAVDAALGDARWPRCREQLGVRVVGDAAGPGCVVGQELELSTSVD